MIACRKVRWCQILSGAAKLLKDVKGSPGIMPPAALRRSLIAGRDDIGLSMCNVMLTASSE